MRDLLKELSKIDFERWGKDEIIKLIQFRDSLTTCKICDLIDENTINNPIILKKINIINRGEIPKKESEEFLEIRTTDFSLEKRGKNWPILLKFEIFNYRIISEEFFQEYCENWKKLCVRIVGIDFRISFYEKYLICEINNATTGDLKVISYNKTKIEEIVYFIRNYPKFTLEILDSVSPFDN